METEEHSLVKKKHRTLNGCRKKILLGGPNENEATKVFRKVMMAFRSVVFALSNQKRVQATISTKAETRIRKEEARKCAYLRSRFSALEPPREEGQRHSWESDDWFSN